MGLEGGTGRLAGLATATLCDADPAVKALAPEIRAMWPGARLSGPARTARTPAGENAAVHRAVAAARPGEVLVVDAGGCEDYAVFGEIRELRFPVFARAARPVACAKRDPGAVDCGIVCGGVPVAPGDWIAGDDDGVIVVPRGKLDDIAAAARKVAEREDEILDELARGRTTREILGIAP